jgi:hypothetical protein
MLDSLVFFLILWVALMPDRFGYDEGGSRRSKPEGTPPPPPPPPIAKAGLIWSFEPLALVWGDSLQLHMLTPPWLEDIPPRKRFLFQQNLEMEWPINADEGQSAWRTSQAACPVSP